MNWYSFISGFSVCLALMYLLELKVITPEKRWSYALIVILLLAAAVRTGWFA
jgi:hypothetical protein